MVFYGSLYLTYYIWPSLGQILGRGRSCWSSLLYLIHFPKVHAHVLCCSFIWLMKRTWSLQMWGANSLPLFLSPSLSLPLHLPSQWVMVNHLNVWSQGHTQWYPQSHDDARLIWILHISSFYVAPFFNVIMWLSIIWKYLNICDNKSPYYMAFAWDVRILSCWFMFLSS